jgi:hypothetical protein
MEIQCNEVLHSSLIILSNTPPPTLLYSNKYPKFVGAETRVWIIGSSLIHYAYDHAILNYADQHLHLQPYNMTLRWFGKRGMVWEEVEPKVHQLLSQSGHPDVIMLHCGGNSIGTMLLRHLKKIMKVTITFKTPYLIPK